MKKFATSMTTFHTLFERWAESTQPLQEVSLDIAGIMNDILHTGLLQGEAEILFKTSRETLGLFLTKELLAANGCWRRINVFFWECGHWYVSHVSSVAPPRYICVALIRISGYNTTTTKHEVGKGCIKEAMEKMRECRNHNHIPLFKKMKITRIKKKILKN